MSILDNLWNYNRHIFAKNLYFKKYNCNNLAINLGNNLNFAIYWNKTNKEYFLQLR